MDMKNHLAAQLLLGLACVGFPSPAPGADAPPAAGGILQPRFLDPPADGRILKIIHGWPDPPDAQDARIRKLKEQGFGGVVCNVAFDGGYVESEAKWNAFLRGVREAKKAGMAMWLYDEKGYPSGNAGGIVLRDHPALQARGLLIADAETAGTNVTLQAPPGRLVLAAGFRVTHGRLSLASRTPLEGHVEDGRLQWQPPAGRWRILLVTEDRLYEGTHAAHNVHEHIPYVDLLEREATARFIEATHQRYAEKLDENLGRWFMATFTDEPSLMSLFLSPMPYRVLPWTAGLPAEFRRRRGYDLEPLLPALVADCDGPGLKTRHDFWLTVGELVAENYFGQIQTWCARHRIPSGGHLLFEEDLRHQVASYGDFYRCIRRLDAPGIDVLTSLPPDVPFQIGRLLASAGELTGRTLVMSETSDFLQRYRPPGDARPVRTVTEEEIRGTLNRLMVSGVNCFTSYFSFQGLDDAAIRRLNEWAGRCCAVLRGGHQAADVAVVYPTESLWVRFVPSRHHASDAGEAGRVEEAYRAAVSALFHHGEDYAVIDAAALEDARAGDGFLTHGALRWRAVVLPRVDTLPLAAWERLAAFARRGGVVVALAARPANSEREFPSPRVQAIAREMFGEEGDRPCARANASGGGGVFLPEGTEALLPRVLREWMGERQVRASGAGAPLRVTHRVVGSEDVYFIINDNAAPWSGTIAVRADRAARRTTAPALWRPASGAVEPLAAPGDIPLRLERYDAVFVAGLAARPPVCSPLQSGEWPGLRAERLPVGKVDASGGEFVQRAIDSDVARAREGSPAWRLTGVLTRGQVDTFLFALFPCAAPSALQSAEWLVLDTWVPDGQAAEAQVLVILCERGGAHYIAASGRRLSAGGYRRAFVPIDRFTLAGWSKDANGRLDLGEVTEIRIGWGGYLGREGERIEFSLAAPEVVRLSR